MLEYYAHYLSHSLLLPLFLIYTAILTCSQFCFILKADTKKKKTKTGTLEAILILSHLSKFHNYICFIFKLLLPNSVQQPETQQLLGSGVVFLFFPGFNSTTIKALWLWNTITNSANAPASLQAILCQCCTYCVVLQMQ